MFGPNKRSLSNHLAIQFLVGFMFLYGFFMCLPDNHAMLIITLDEKLEIKIMDKTHKNDDQLIFFQYSMLIK